MAQCITFTCDQCGFHVDSWDDGNPYVQDESGKRHFYYHPAHNDQDSFERELFLEGVQLAQEPGPEGMQVVSGNEGAYLCMNCGRLRRCDPKRDRMVCSKCKKRDLLDTEKLEGASCPKCKQGHLLGEFTGIS